MSLSRQQWDAVHALLSNQDPDEDVRGYDPDLYEQQWATERRFVGRLVVAAVVGVVVAVLWWVGGFWSVQAQERVAPRFVRLGMSRLDDNTYVDLVRDNVTERCFAIYRSHVYSGIGSTAIASVPCQ
jgi:hypothetical protein